MISASVTISLSSTFNDISEQSHEDYAGDDAAALADYAAAKLEEF